MRPESMKSVFLWATCFLGAIVGQEASAQLCPPLPHDAVFKVSDYNDPATSFESMEAAHFTPQVENLIRGTTSELPYDIHFVLNNVPNHHRALRAMARWQLKHPVSKDRRIWAIDCYFKRALALTPNDPRVHFVRALYFQEAGRLPEARTEYARADELGLDNAEFFYNRGLLEFDAGDLESARTFAQEAYARGYPLPALRLKLEKAGVPLR